jgi:hypothetical protein
MGMEDQKYQACLVFFLLPTASRFGAGPDFPRWGAKVERWTMGEPLGAKNGSAAHGFCQSMGTLLLFKSSKNVLRCYMIYMVLQYVLKSLALDVCRPWLWDLSKYVKICKCTADAIRVGDHFGAYYHKPRLDTSLIVVTASTI